jgi:hypothetical protein
MKRIPYALLIPAALLLAVAPLSPEPHLVEKLRMLAAGTLRRPIDIFDLFLHGGPLALLLTRLALDGRARLGGRS